LGGEANGSDVVGVSMAPKRAGAVPSLVWLLPAVEAGALRPAADRANTLPPAELGIGPPTWPPRRLSSKETRRGCARLNHPGKGRRGGRERCGGDQK